MHMPEPGKPQSAELGWTLPQRRALLVLLSLFLVALIVQLLVNRRFVSDHAAHGGRSDELASRLDPNTADWQALAAIPNLGEKRAKDIVSYRNRARGIKPGAVVFKSVYDLRVIRGIGPAMVEKLRPYLIFPGEDPASLPTPAEDPDARQ
jgi:helix-hairpin-helix protein